MTKTELARDMKTFVGAGVISNTELCKYLGQTNKTRIKAQYLSGLTPIAGKKYFIPEVAEAIMEKRRFT